MQMRRTQFHLLRSRRFAPLFVTQFLGAMNDNLFKQSLVILIGIVTLIGSGRKGPHRRPFRLPRSHFPIR